MLDLADNLCYDRVVSESETLNIIQRGECKMNTIKLKSALELLKVKAMGFPAVKGLESYSKEEGSEVVVSTLPASVLAEQGITEYLAPRFERGQVFQTTEDMIAADIDLGAYKIVADFDPKELRQLTLKKNTVIVSRHEGTIEILKGMYRNAEVFSGNVEPKDIEGKHVIGTLPPFLIASAGIYTPVTIKDFDYNVDGDLSGEELDERLVIGDPFQLKEVEITLDPVSSLSNIDKVKEVFANSSYSGEYYNECVEVEVLGEYFELELETALTNLGYKTKTESFYSQLDASVTVAVKDNEIQIFKHLYV